MGARGGFGGGSGGSATTNASDLTSGTLAAARLPAAVYPLSAALAAAGVPVPSRQKMTAATLMTVDVTPIVFVPAPGANKVVVPTKLVFGTSLGSSGQQISTWDGNFYWGDDNSGVPVLVATLVRLIDNVMDQGNQINVVYPLLDDVSRVPTYRTDSFVLSDIIDKAIVFQSTSKIWMPGAIVGHALNVGGTQYAVGDTFAVQTYYETGVLATGTVTAASNSFAISAVDQGAKTFTVVGDASAFVPTDAITLYGSTGNDNGYTTVSAVFSGGHTVITVVEDIIDATADGHLGNATAGSVGVITGYTLNTFGDQYSGQSGTGELLPTTGVGSGAVIDITSTDVSVNTGVTTMTLHYDILDFTP